MRWLILIGASVITFYIFARERSASQVSLLRSIWRNQYTLYFIFVAIFLGESILKLKFQNEISSIQITTLRYTMGSIAIGAFGFKYLTSLKSFKIQPKSLSVVVLIMFIAGVLVHFGLSSIINQDWFWVSDLSLLRLRIPYILLFIGMLPSITEELLYRGLLYDKLLSNFSERETILITSVLFYLMHLIFTSSLLSFIWLLPLGIILGFVRSKSGSIVLPIVGHFTYNVTVSLLPVFL